MKNNQKTGKIGEELAVEFLKKQGCQILETNYHAGKFGEIDIIAKEKNTLVMVEVKTRTSLAFGHPFEAITKQKMKKFYTASLIYFQKQTKYKIFRLDCVSVLLTKPVKIEHLKNLSLL